MCFFRIGYSLAVGIALKPFHDARADLLSRRRLGGGDKWCKRRCGQMVQREFIRPREVHIEANDAHVRRSKARFRCKPLQLLFGRDLSRGAKLQGSFVADKSSE